MFVQVLLTSPYSSTLVRIPPIKDQASPLLRNKKPGHYLLLCSPDTKVFFIGWIERGKFGMCGRPGREPVTLMHDRRRRLAEIAGKRIGFTRCYGQLLLIRDAD